MMKRRLPKFGRTAILSDLAQMANGAASALGEVRSEMSAKLHGQAEATKNVVRRGVDVATSKTSKFAASVGGSSDSAGGNTTYSATGSSAGHFADMVPREDFDAALARITALGERIASLEAQLKGKTPAKAKIAKKAAKKSAAKKA